MTLNLFDQDTIFEDYMEYKQKEWLKQGREEGREEGERKGREEGKRKGREESRNELIQKWRAKGYTEEQIADLLA